MPSYVTHIIFGQNVLSKLEKIGESSSAAIIKSNQVAFCWGAQGPDILFFRDAFDKKRVSNLGDYGALMHKTKTNELLSALVDIIGSSDATDAEKAYIYGFFCHYALDMSLHPYVYYMQEKWRPNYESSLPYGIHMKIETDMDTAMFNKYIGGNIRCYKMNPALKSDHRQLDAIAKVQCCVLEKIYGGHFSVEDIYKCIENDFNREVFMFDPLYIKSYFYAKFLEFSHHEKNSFCANCRPKRIKYDVLNENKLLWYNFRLKGKPQHTSVPEIFDAAVDVAVNLIVESSGSKSQQLKMNFYPEMPTFDDGNPQVFGLTTD